MFHGCVGLVEFLLAEDPGVEEGATHHVSGLFGGAESLLIFLLAQVVLQVVNVIFGSLPVLTFLCLGQGLEFSDVLA